MTRPHRITPGQMQMPWTTSADVNRVGYWRARTRKAEQERQDALSELDGIAKVLGMQDTDDDMAHEISEQLRLREEVDARLAALETALRDLLCEWDESATDFAGRYIPIRNSTIERAREALAATGIPERAR